MKNDPKIIWLASYPKSGNTWFRSFLHATFYDGHVDITNLAVSKIFSSKSIIENYMDTAVDDLNPQESEWIKNRCWQNMSDASEQPIIVKIHDAFENSKWNNRPIIPFEATKMAIYLVRNPLDVTVSFSNHQGLSLERIVRKFINNPEAALVKNNKSNNQFYQSIQSWSQHVNSWIDQAYFPVHIVRYEDLKTHPFETFSRAIEAMGYAYKEAAIKKAIAACSFENLKKQEKDYGFPEKSFHSSSFFFKGETNRGIRELPKILIDEILSTHAKTMKRLGYSTESIIP